MRVGIGQDSHWFETSKRKPLVLGGIKLADKGGFKANSDGDVILHALFNALSSAIGGDSLAVYVDKICLEEGITDSKEYLKVASKMVNKAGYKVNNVSIAVEAKKPRVSLKDVGRMKEITGKILKISEDCIGITFTSGEGITPFGKGKAVQVFCLVSLVKK